MVVGDSIPIYIVSLTRSPQPQSPQAGGVVVLQTRRECHIVGRFVSVSSKVNLS